MSIPSFKDFGAIERRMTELNSILERSPSEKQLHDTSQELSQLQTRLFEAVSRTTDQTAKQILSRLHEQCQQVRELAQIQLMSMDASPADPSARYVEFLGDLTKFQEEIGNEVKMRGFLSPGVLEKYQAVYARFIQGFKELQAISRPNPDLTRRIVVQLEQTNGLLSSFPRTVVDERRLPTAIVSSHAEDSVCSLDGGRLIFASQNQYSDRYNREYGEGPVFKRSACTAIAGFFARDMLSLATAGAIPTYGMDDCMLKGQQLMARLSKSVREVEHLSFEEVSPHFPEMRFLERETQDIILTPAGRENFKAALERLNTARVREGEEGIAAVLSGRGESYAIAIVPNRETSKGFLYYFLDSHGHAPLTGSADAFCLCFNTMDELASFLTKRCPFVAEEGMEYYNYMNLYPVISAERAFLSAPTRREKKEEARAVETPSTTPARPSSSTLLSEMQDLLAQSALTGSEDQEDLAIAKVFALREMGLEKWMDRLALHMYWVHRTSAPHKLKKDMHYGEKAFLGTAEYQADASERLRVCQRVLIESLLVDLQEAVQKGEDALVRGLLDRLGSLRLSPKDLPRECLRLDHFLYGLLYRSYEEARGSAHRSLPPPDHRDFGRVGFRNEEGRRVPSEIKAQALERLQRELRKRWIPS